MDVETADPLRVLVIDDNRDFADNLAELARADGATVRCVHDLAGGREASLSDFFEVVLLDQRLPDGKGTELLAEIRHRNPDAVVVLITAYASLASTVAALNHGAFAFVSKDSPPDDLYATLSRALEQGRLIRQMQRLHERQDALLTANPDLLLLTDEDGRVHSLNREDPWICTAAATEGCELSEVLRPEVDEAIDWPDWAQAVLTGEDDGKSRTIKARGEDGLDRVFDVRLLEVKVQPRSLLLLRFVDITDRILLEQRLQAAESMAALGRLSSSVAHEIRNPIAGIRVLAQVMERALPPDDPQRENTREIVVLADRLSETITDLLQFAKPEQPNRQPFDLRQILDEVVAEAQRWPRYERQSLEQRSDEGLVMVGNQGRVRSAVAALIENALDATHPEGHILVQARLLDDTHLEVTVEDDGKGLDEVEEIDSLFQPFVTHKTQGTGLGLAIVRRVVDAHGGRVEAGTSEELGGALFRIVLPLDPLRPSLAAR